MHLKWTTRLAVIAAVIAAAALIVEARRVTLRPLSADEVYKILKAARREDAVPEGRVVTQGIAALSGFTLGVANGVGAVIVYDLITAPNETIEWLNGIFAAPPANTTVTTAPIVTSEICFQSRSLEDDDPQGRHSTPTAMAPTSTRTGTETGSLEDDEHQARQTSPTSTAPTSPPPSATTTFTPTATGGTATTGTDTAGSEDTCIVIEKPKARHRRRRSTIRKYERQHLKLKVK